MISSGVFFFVSLKYVARSFGTVFKYLSTEKNSIRSSGVIFTLAAAIHFLRASITFCRYTLGLSSSVGLIFLYLAPYPLSVRPYLVSRALFRLSYFSVLQQSSC